MASSLNDPKLLYAIPGVSAYHIANGVEDSLTPAGPQTLSLLMVPTASPFADASVDSANGGNGVSAQEEDFYLHLHLPPELDLPLPATTQIYHQPPSSYLIPRWDLGHNSGVFTRIEFPPAGSRKGLQEDVDTFETILAQCTAFLERAPPPKIRKGSNSRPVPPPPASAAAAARADAVRGGGGGSSSRAATFPRQEDQKQSPGRAVSRSSTHSKMTEGLPAYNPGDYKPGEAYVAGSHSSQMGGQIVLIDEEDGSVIGELSEGFNVVEHQTLKPGSKEPVEITLPTEAVPNISVAPASREDVEALHPAYRKSFLVSNAAAASRLIVATSEVVSRALQSQADNYARKAQPVSKPMTFQPSTHAHIRRINTISTSAAGLSAKAVGQVGKVAQNLGASLAGHRAHSGSGGGGGIKSGPGSIIKGRGSSATGVSANGEYVENFKPGLLNKSLMAFSTVVDGIEQAGRHLLDSSSTAATTVASHKWGPEAGEVTRNIGTGIKNVGLVYIDVTGVSRRAIIKSVAKGMVVGHVPGGGDLIVGDGSSGAAVAPAGGKTSPPQSSRSSSVRESHSPAKAGEFADKNPYRNL